MHVNSCTNVTHSTKYGSIKSKTKANETNIKFFESRPTFEKLFK